MTTTAFRIDQNKLLPTWPHVICRDDGTPVDLRGCTVSVRFSLLDGTGTSIERACTVAEPFLGQVTVVWVTGDTAVAGVYSARFEVTFPGAVKECFPAGGWPLHFAIAPAL